MNEAQSRISRTVLKLDVRELAKLAKVAPSTIVKFERGEVVEKVTVKAVSAVFERSGIVSMYGNEIILNSIDESKRAEKVAAWKQSVGLTTNASE